MADSSFADKLRSWGKLVNTLRPYLAEMPHVAEDHAALEALVTRLIELDQEGEVHTSRLREATRFRQQAEKTGAQIRNRLVAALQARWGHTSTKLIEFGIDPRPLVIRRPTKAEKELEELKAKQAAEAAQQEQKQEQQEPPPAG